MTDEPLVISLSKAQVNMALAAYCDVLLDEILLQKFGTLRLHYEYKQSRPSKDGLRFEVEIRRVPEPVPIAKESVA